MHEYQVRRTSPSSRNWRETSVPLQPGRRPSASGSCVVEINLRKVDSTRKIPLQHASAADPNSIHFMAMLEGEHFIQPMVSFCCLNICVLSEQAPLKYILHGIYFSLLAKARAWRIAKQRVPTRQTGCSCRQNADRRWRLCFCVVYACAGHISNRHPCATQHTRQHAR